MKKEKTTKAKKPIYRKWWFWLIIVSIVFGALSDLTTDKKKTDEKAKTETVEEKKEEPQKVWTDDEIIDLANEQFKEFGGRFEKYDEGVIVYYAEDDIAAGIETLIYDYGIDNKISEDNKELYNDFINSFKTVSLAIDTATNKATMLNVANPTNKENIVISFIGGKVVYNAFEE